jgi:Fanconi anemia group J protein
MIDRIYQNFQIQPYVLGQLQAKLNMIEEDRKSFGRSPDRDPMKDPVWLSQGSCRILGSLYLCLNNIFHNSQKHLDSFRMIRQREYKFGTIIKILSFVDDARKKIAIDTIAFWCLNPEVVFREIAESAKAVILTSGTLSPMETFSSELGVRFDHTLEAMHVIEKGQVWVGSIGIGPSGCELKGTFKELETFAFQDDICRAILDICKAVPHGVLCFLPSYSFMDKLLKRMELIGVLSELKKLKKVFSEPRQGASKEFERLMKSYYKVIADTHKPAPSSRLTGGIFFAVYRGKVSEGLDFADENARAVISVGIPYPAFKDEKVVQKRAYNDLFGKEQGLLNGHMWYEKQAFRALNQALGRCIRHKNDWGAVILLERRFHQEAPVAGLSKWIRPEVKRFMDYHDALLSLDEYIKLMEETRKTALPQEAEDILSSSNEILNEYE